MIMPGAAAVPGGADRLRREAGRAADGGGVPAAQPGRGDHRRRDRRADHRGQRVQAPDQQRFPLDLGVPEFRALLGVPVDPLLHRVDVDERQHLPAGQQRRLPRQFREELPAGLLQLRDVPPGIGAQVRAERGRGADAAEQGAHRAVPQHVHVIDRSPRPAAMPATRTGTFRCAFTPQSPRRADVLRDQLAAGRRARRGPSPGPARRATRDAGHRTQRWSCPGHATISLTRCPLEPGDGSVRYCHSPSSEGTFHVNTPERTPI